MNEMRKLIETIEQINESSDSNIINGIRREQDIIHESMSELQVLARWALKGGHTATEASINNALADLHNAKKILDAAVGDIGKQYTL